MPLLSFTNLILETIVALLLATIYVFLRDKKASLISKVFVLNIAASLIWVLTNIIANYYIENDSQYLIWSRLTMLGPALLPVSLVWFANIFPSDHGKLGKGWLAALTIVALTMIALIPTNLNIRAVSNGDFTPGLLYVAIVILLLLALVYCFVKLSLKISRVSEQEKWQIRTILIGFGFSIFFGVITNAILPIAGISGAAVYGSSSVIFFIIATAYAILRYQLLNVKLIVTEIATYVTLLILSIELLTSNSIIEVAYRAPLLIGVGYAGYLVIRSVKYEVARREEVEKLASKLENANDELRRDKEQLVELDRMKDEFLQMATHELNTPISVIKGRLNMALDENLCKLNDEQKKFLQPVLDDTTRLAQLSRDILDTARIDQRRLKLNLAEINVAEMVKRIVNDLQIKARDKKIQLIFEKSSDEIPSTMADESKISEVVTNLINNAIKFTDKGYVKATVGVDTNKIVVSIKDTGIGIEEKDRKHLFQKFYQAGRFDPNHPREQQGTGLGLYISKNIINLHGGEISLISDFGKGSAFTFTLPIKASQASEEVAHLTPSGQGVA